MTYQNNILQLAKDNTNFRMVLETTTYSQVVLMSLQPGEDIGLEKHHVDQIIVIVEGQGEAELNGRKGPIMPGQLIAVPAGTKHNFTNGMKGHMKLYTIYAPPEHRDGTIHKTKAEAEADELDHPDA